jgi:presenilin-like A22 family membrane protease
MKYSIVTMGIILTLFLVTQFVGLAVNKYYITQELPYGLTPPDIKTEFSPLFFVGMIAVVTVAFFFFKYMNLELLLKVWFFLAFVAGISVTLSAFIEPTYAIFAALAIVIIKFYEHDIYTHNIAEVFLYGGIVALFVPILNIWAVVVIMLVVSVYDFISVFMTKHMIKLAKMQEDLGIFTGLIVAHKNELAILGGGDIAFTMLFAVVLLRDFGNVPAMLAIYGAALGLLVLMILGEKKKFYPAMPFVTIGSFLGFGLSLLV